jgi:hypothetical protein
MVEVVQIKAMDYFFVLVQKVSQVIGVFHEKVGIGYSENG